MGSDSFHGESTNVPQVLLVGSAGHREFAGALRQVDSSAHARLLCDWSAARNSLKNASSNNASSRPDLVILLRNRPDGMLASDVAELTKLAPNSRFVWLLGSWCEGEAHTGQTWDGLEKVYWHTFRHWWNRYRRTFSGCDSGCDSGRDDFSKVIETQLAVVHSKSVITFEAVADSLSVAGCSAVWQHPHRRAPLVSGASVGIWDGGQLIPHEQKCLRAFCRSLGIQVGTQAGLQVPVIALFDFPQFDQVQLAHKLGASEVLGKPWKEDDLIAACGFTGTATCKESYTKSKAA